MILPVLLLALPAVLSSQMEERAGNDVLKATYPRITFNQSRQTIASYTKESIQSLLKSVNDKNGQFLGGAKDTLGQFFFWQSINGWTSVAQYDLQQGQKEFSSAWSDAQGKLAKDPGHGFGKWGVELCNDFNDDCGWAGLGSLVRAPSVFESKLMSRPDMRLMEMRST
jgi:hypothetical protein